MASDAVWPFDTLIRSCESWYCQRRYGFKRRCPQISRKSRSQLRILGAGSVSCNQFHTEDQQLNYYTPP